MIDRGMLSFERRAHGREHFGKCAFHGLSSEERSLTGHALACPPPEMRDYLLPDQLHRRTDFFWFDSRKCEAKSQMSRVALHLLDFCYQVIRGTDDSAEADRTRVAQLTDRRHSSKVL